MESLPAVRCQPAQPETRRFAMSLFEETIDATLDTSGALRLSQQPQVPPGPVRVTIRVAGSPARRKLADVVGEIAAEQRSRGFSGRSAEDLLAEDESRTADDAERDREQDVARNCDSSGGP